MKKIFALAIICACVLLTLCGCNEVADSNPIGNYAGDMKELTSAQETVLKFHENGKKFPENFVFAELEGYGRVLESASSEKEARGFVEKRFTNGWCTTVANGLVVETNLFYGLYAKWAYQSDGDKQPIYYDEYVVSFKKDVYDSENNKFGTKNQEDIKKILDYIYYSHTYQIGGYKVYSSDISRNAEKYEYTIYRLEVCYGDWGLQDQLTFVKEVQSIDIKSGKILRTDREVLQSFGVDGNLTHGGVVYD